MRSWFIISNSILFLFYILMFIPIHYVPKDFKNRYDEYMFITNSNCYSNQYRHPYKFLMKFSDLKKDGAAGLSTYITGLLFDISTIKIDISEWNDYNENERTELIFHELTHALFNYRDLYEDKYYNHFMYYRIIGSISELDTKRQLNELLQILCKK